MNYSSFFDGREASEMRLQMLDIIDGTSVDGPHLRTSFYFAGCTHACPGCHNPQSWDPRGTFVASPTSLLRHLEETELPVTLTGGDPLYQAPAMARLTAEIKRHLGINIWLYTGYTWEVIQRTPRFLDVVRNVDVVVDGPFMLKKRDTSLLFRGSSNQRLIDVPASLAAGAPITLHM